MLQFYLFLSTTKWDIIFVQSLYMKMMYLSVINLVKLNYTEIWLFVCSTGKLTFMNVLLCIHYRQKILEPSGPAGEFLLLKVLGSIPHNDSHFKKWGLLEMILVLTWLFTCIAIVWSDYKGKKPWFLEVTQHQITDGKKILVDWGQLNRKQKGWNRKPVMLCMF